MLKQAINMWAERYGSILLWAVLARDFCMLPRFLTLNNLLHCVHPCQQNVSAHANRMSTPMPIEAHVLFVFALLVPGFISTSILYYVMRKRQQVAALATLTVQTLYFSLQVQTSIRI